MLSEPVRLGMWIVGLTLLSGVGDAFGFLHAAAMWQEGRLIWREFGLSAFGFAFGITAFWLAVRFMKQVGIVAPEIQTLIWFAVTMIGVALASGKFFHWPWREQIVAITVLGGIGWLLVHTGE
ncbi:MAG: hypothetical protein KJ063_00760 [Anaerolineae bacterium]|nr:hypothetical protein [Anaerolineae bacterium]